MERTISLKLVGLTCRSAVFFLQVNELKTAAFPPLIHDSNSPPVYFLCVPVRISAFGLRILTMSILVKKIL